jgi:hypothetical protein
MGNSYIFNEKFRRPSISFNETLKKGGSGAYVERGDFVPFMFRAVVIAADLEGGKLETPDGNPSNGVRLVEQVIGPSNEVIASYTIDPTVGPYNPKNSVRARIIAGNADLFTDDDQLRTFWPLFPGVDNPSAGEPVYVTFEDEDMLHGLWICKCPTNIEDETPNQTLMSQIAAQVTSLPLTDRFPDTAPLIQVQTENGPQLVKDPQRLSKLFGI